MPRPKRIHYEGALYHVTSRGNERKKIVWDDADRELFVQVLARTVEQHQLQCHGWVLMDNHYHLLVETPTANLAIAMQHLNGIYTQKFNRRHHRVGHLFQGRYKAIHVDKDSYLLELCRYVVLNPVRAKMVEHPKDWRWSSYRSTAGMEKAPSWLETTWILGQFGKRSKAAQRAYRAFVQEGIRDKSSPWEGVKAGVFLGEEEFLGKMGRLLSKDKDLDVPKYQKQVSRPKVEEVLKKISEVFQVELKDILGRRKGNEARDLAIYLLRREAGLNSRETAKRLGVGGSAVRNRLALVQKRLAEDTKFALRVRKCQMTA